jgi:hypothetical protein
VRLFRQMERLECTCPERDWSGEYWKHTPCAGCERWWELHSLLHDALSLRPFDWPAIESPDARNPYPAGSPAAVQWEPGREAQARYVALKAASAASKLERGKPQ